MVHQWCCYHNISFQSKKLLEVFNKYFYKNSDTDNVILYWRKFKKILSKTKKNSRSCKSWFVLWERALLLTIKIQSFHQQRNRDLESPESSNSNNDEILKMKFEYFTYSIKTTLVTTEDQILKQTINNLNINSVNVSEYSSFIHQIIRYWRGNLQKISSLYS